MKRKIITLIATFLIFLPVLFPFESASAEHSEDHSQESVDLPISMYHGVNKTHISRYVLPVSQLGEDLKWIRENG